MYMYKLLFIAIVSEVSATPLNSTSVMVSWTPVNLTVMYHYTVHYTTVGGVNGTVIFPDTVSSGVVSGLQGGQQYQFSVTVTLNISGELYTGSPKNTLPPITCMYTLPKYFRLLSCLSKFIFYPIIIVPLYVILTTIGKHYCMCILIVLISIKRF